jgi:energy-coupling factor transporter transmembrane protein EcfT
MKQINHNMKHLLLLCFIFASTTTVFSETNKAKASPFQNEIKITDRSESQHISNSRDYEESYLDYLLKKLILLMENLLTALLKLHWIIQLIIIATITVIIFFIIMLLIFLVMHEPSIVMTVSLILISLGLIPSPNNRTAPPVAIEEMLLPEQEQLSFSPEKQTTLAAPRNQNTAEDNPSVEKLLELLPEIDSMLIPNKTKLLNNTETLLKEMEEIFEKNTVLIVDPDNISPEIDALKQTLTQTSKTIAPILEVLENGTLETISKELNNSKMMKEASTEVPQLNPFQELEVNVFPNPSYGPLTVELKNKNDIQNKTNIVVFSASGQLLVNETIVDKKVQFNLADYAPGTYLIKITNGQHTITKRLIKR